MCKIKSNIKINVKVQQMELDIKKKKKTAEIPSPFYISFKGCSNKTSGDLTNPDHAALQSLAVFVAEFTMYSTSEVFHNFFFDQFLQ